MKKIALVLLVFLFTSIGSHAATLEHIETPCTKQAPQKIVEMVESVASLVNFEQDYEIAEPKKAGLQVNPWNKFLSHGINLQTNNPIIILNSDWFLKIPEKQQEFLLGRCFFSFSHGIAPFSVKIIPYLFGLFSILFIIFLVWIFGKTGLRDQKKWIRIVLAFIVSALFNMVFTYRLQNRFLEYFGRRHDMKINEMVLQKISNRRNAIKALRHFDMSIKNELKNDEEFWAPYAKLFEEYANQLER